jgi:hypothetical protein
MAFNNIYILLSFILLCGIVIIIIFSSRSSSNTQPVPITSSIPTTPIPTTPIPISADKKIAVTKFNDIMKSIFFQDQNTMELLNFPQVQNKLYDLSLKIINAYQRLYPDITDNYLALKIDLDFVQNNKDLQQLALQFMEKEFYMLITLYTDFTYCKNFQDEEKCNACKSILVNSLLSVENPGKMPSEQLVLDDNDKKLLMEIAKKCGIENMCFRSKGQYISLCSVDSKCDEKSGSCKQIQTTTFPPPLTTFPPPLTTFPPPLTTFPPPF